MRNALPTKGRSKTDMTARIKIISTLECEFCWASSAPELSDGLNAAINLDASFILDRATLAFWICGAAFQLFCFFGLLFHCFKGQILSRFSYRACGASREVFHSRESDYGLLTARLYMFILAPSPSGRNQ